MIEVEIELYNITEINAHMILYIRFFLRVTKFATMGKMCNYLLFVLVFFCDLKKFSKANNTA